MDAVASLYCPDKGKYLQVTYDLADPVIMCPGCHEPIDLRIAGKYEKEQECDPKK